MRINKLYKPFKGTSVWNADRTKMLGCCLYFMPIYLSARNENKHFYVKYNGWGFDKYLVDRLINDGIMFIAVITDTKIYTCDIDDVRTGPEIKMGKDSQVIMQLSDCCVEFH